MKKIKQITDQKNELYPNFGSSGIAIVIASSDKYFCFLKVLITSIALNRNEKDNYDIIILSDGITEIHRKQLLCQFCNENFSIRFVDVSHWLDDMDLYTALHVTKTTYLRLTIIDLLVNFKKVIYLDCDTVVNINIRKLYDIDITDFMVAAVTDSIMHGWYCMEDNNGKEQRTYLNNTIGIREPDKYFNAGVLLINIKEFIKRGYSSDKLLNIAISQRWRWFDQDVLNIVCKNHVKYISQKWNVMVHAYKNVNAISEAYLPNKWRKKYFESVDNPYIVHFAGRVLPVFVPRVKNNKLFWKYARVSGSFFSLLIILESNIIKKIFEKVKCK